MRLAAALLMISILTFPTVSSLVPTPDLPTETVCDALAAVGPDTVGVGYATDATRALIRWRYHNDATTPQAASYRVTRVHVGTEEAVVTEVAPIADPTAAAAFIDGRDARWPALTQTLIQALSPEAALVGAPMSTPEDLFRHLWMANATREIVFDAYYPVAEAMGFAYLDDTTTPGATYRYTVVALGDALAQQAPAAFVGSVELVAGRATPLAPPTRLLALNMAPGQGIVAARTADWAAVSASQQYDRMALLQIVVDGPQDVECSAQAWEVGHDLYADFGAGLARVGDSVVRRAPPPAEGPRYDAAIVFPTPGTREVCAVGHDLLGTSVPASQVRARGACAMATVYDLVPPPRPGGLSATLTPAAKVSLTWGPSVAADLAQYEVWRTRNVSAKHVLQAPACANELVCWVQRGTTTSLTFEDPAPVATDVWYRVVPTDTSGNRGLAGGPVHAYVPDSTPPGPPTIVAKPGNIFTVAHGAPSQRVVMLELRCDMAGGTSYVLLDQAKGVAHDFDLDALWTVPETFDVRCVGVAVDEHGLRSAPSAPASATLAPAAAKKANFPAPVLDEVRTTEGRPELRWTFPDLRLLGKFTILRTDVETGQVVDVAVSTSQRSYVDTDANPTRVYSYRVRVEPLLGSFLAVRTSNALVWTGIDGDARTLPTLFEAVTFGTGLFGRASVPNLTWACHQCDLDTKWAVFRSTRETEGYFQLTPVFTPSYVDIGLQRKYTYVDNSGRLGEHWYVVVAYSSATGEPFYRSAPALAPGSHGTRAPDFADASVVPFRGTPAIGLGCTTGATAIPLLGWQMGGGVTLVPTGPVTRSFADGSYSGEGYLSVQVSRGIERLSVSFTGIKLSTAGDVNRVCGGTVTHAPAFPLQVSSDELDFLVYRFTAYPATYSGTNAMPRMDIIVQLPDDVTYAYDGAPDVGGFPLANVRTDSTLAVNAVGTTQTCAAPVGWIESERLPIRFVPTGTVGLTGGRLTFSGGCQQYLDRFHPPPGVARPSPTNLRAGDSNDRFLTLAFSPATGSVAPSIGASGFDATMAATGTVTWTGSMPFGMSITAKGPHTVVIEDGRIAGGSLGPGSATFAMSKAALGANESDVATRNVSTHTATVAAWHLLPGGRLLAQNATVTGLPFAWLGAQGFTASVSRYDILTANVTTATAVNASDVFGRHADWFTPTDVGLQRPPMLDPGVNLRGATSDVRWSGCSGSKQFAAPVDAYVRFGGMTGLYDLRIASGSSFKVFGYDVTTDLLKIAFVDNLANDVSMVGKLSLPAPAGFAIPYSDGTLDRAGCVATLKPKAGTTVTTKYWGTTQVVEMARFADPEMGDAPTTAPYTGVRLWTSGDITNIPRLYSSSGTSRIDAIPASIAFDASGNATDVRMSQDAAQYRFNGQPILLSGIRLSMAPPHVNGIPGADGEMVKWPQAANLEAPPATFDPKVTGFIEIEGPLVVPGFGLTKPGPEGGARFQLVLPRAPGAAASGDGVDTASLIDDLAGYVGATAARRLDQLWVDNAEGLLHAVFDNVVYFPDPDVVSDGPGIGRLIVFDDITVGEAEPVSGEAPFALDMALVVSADPGGGPGQIDGFVGHAAGVGALWAAAVFDDEVPKTSCAAATQALSAKGYAEKLIPSAKRGTYLQTLCAAWAHLPKQDPGYDRAGAVTSALDANRERLPDGNAVGGGTGGAIYANGVEVDRVRGGITFGPGFEFQSFLLRARVAFEAGGTNLIAADDVAFTVKQDGRILILAENVRFLDLTDALNLDVTILIVPNEPRFEAAFEIEDIDLEAVRIREAGVYFGIGGKRFGDVFYVGLNFDGEFADYAVGGSVLIGKINTDSEILQANFGTAIASIRKVVPKDGLYSGFYIEAGGRIPIFGNGCELSVKVGAKVAFWYWDPAGPGGAIMGARLTGYALGEVACLASIRGQLTLEATYSSGDIILEGEYWVAGGAGFCEPDDWDTWVLVWADDGCGTIGVRGAARYTSATNELEILSLVWEGPA